MLAGDLNGSVHLSLVVACAPLHNGLDLTFDACLRRIWFGVYGIKSR
jgi:hypothetical protein